MVEETCKDKRVVLRKKSKTPNFDSLPVLIYIRGKPAYIIPTPRGKIGARLGSVDEVEGKLLS